MKLLKVSQKRQTISICKMPKAAKNFLGSFDDIIQQLLSYSGVLTFATKALYIFSWCYKYSFLFHFVGLSARVPSDVRLPSKRRGRERHGGDCGGSRGEIEGKRKRRGGRRRKEGNTRRGGETPVSHHQGHCTCQAKSGNWFLRRKNHSTSVWEESYRNWMFTFETREENGADGKIGVW